MALPRYTNSNNDQFDFAITGVDDDGNSFALPFLNAASEDYPYIRESGEAVRQQIDSTPEPGEQSLQNWWYRSQSSFDLGAGAEYNDTAKDQYMARRFKDSQGVDISVPGEVKLLRKMDLVKSTYVNTRCMGYNAGGSDGIIVAFNETGETNVKLVSITSSGTVSTEFATGAGLEGEIFDMTSDGEHGFTVTEDGIYKWTLPNSSYSKIYTASATRGVMAFVKERLVVAVGTALHVITNTSPASPPASLPTALFTHPTSGWTWSSIVEGPEAVYYSGYKGNNSSIYASVIDDSGSVPVLATPSVIAELPKGEIVRSMFSYMGVYLAIGTNRGVRIAIIQPGGSIAIGPLTLESDTPVTGFAGYRNNIYAAGAVSRQRTGINTYVNRPGLYCIDLSSQIPSPAGGGTGKFAWSHHLHIEDSTSADDTNDVCMIGNTGRVAFTIPTRGAYMEDTVERVDTGWLLTGRIRLDTWEDKIFQYLRVTNKLEDGTIGVWWKGEPEVEAEIYEWATDDIRKVDLVGSDGAPHSHISYLFTLAKGDITTNTPVLTGYQAKAQPSAVKERSLRLSLLCYRVEQSKLGRKIERSTWDRIRWLENAERKNGVVLYQNLNTGEETYCLIENMQFVSQQTPQSRVEQQNPSGVILLTLRTVTAAPGVDVPSGTGSDIIGGVDLYSQLPEDAHTGDVWYVEADGDMYIWSGIDWYSIGHIKGSDGIQGPPGLDSTVPGPEGPEGRAHVIYSGPDVPTGSDPSGAENGDWYLQTTNSGAGSKGDMYKLVSGTWDNRLNIMGPTGQSGADGSNGADSTVPGPAGPEGPQGPQGPPGDSIVPSTGTTGHYLRKTAGGVAWEAVSGGGGGEVTIESVTVVNGNGTVDTGSHSGVENATSTYLQVGNDVAVIAKAGGGFVAVGVKGRGLGTSGVGSAWGPYNAYPGTPCSLGNTSWAGGVDALNLTYPPNLEGYQLHTDSNNGFGYGLDTLYIAGCGTYRLWNPTSGKNLSGTINALMAGGPSDYNPIPFYYPPSGRMAIMVPNAASTEAKLYRWDTSEDGWKLDADVRTLPMPPVPPDGNYDASWYTPLKKMPSATSAAYVDSPTFVRSSNDKLHTFTIGQRSVGGFIQCVLRLYVARDDDTGWDLVDTFTADSSIPYSATYAKSAIYAVYFSPDKKRCRVYATSQSAATMQRSFCFNLNNLDTGTITYTSRFVNYHPYSFSTIIHTHTMEGVSVSTGDPNSFANAFVMDNDGKLWYSPLGYRRSVGSIAPDGAVSINEVLPPLGSPYTPTAGAAHTVVGVHGTRVFMSYLAEKNGPADSAKSWVVTETDGLVSTPVHIVDDVLNDADIVNNKRGLITSGPDNGLIAAIAALDNTTIIPAGLFEV